MTSSEACFTAGGVRDEQGRAGVAPAVSVQKRLHQSGICLQLEGRFSIMNMLRVQTGGYANKPSGLKALRNKEAGYTNVRIMIARASLFLCAHDRRRIGRVWLILLAKYKLFPDKGLRPQSLRAQRSNLTRVALFCL